MALEPVAVAGWGGSADPLDVEAPATVLLEVTIVLDVSAELKLFDGTFWFRAFEEPLETAALRVRSPALC